MSIPYILIESVVANFEFDVQVLLENIEYLRKAIATFLNVLLFTLDVARNTSFEPGAIKAHEPSEALHRTSTAAVLAPVLAFPILVIVFLTRDESRERMLSFLICATFATWLTYILLVGFRLHLTVRSPGGSELDLWPFYWISAFAMASLWFTRSPQKGSPSDIVVRILQTIRDLVKR